VLVIPVSDLKFEKQAHTHKFILLAGPRWSLLPPKDSGVDTKAPVDPNGYVKINCERFDSPEKNLKWILDTLHKLVTASKVSNGTVPTYFAKIVC
jgi:small subunit ribosomal protein S35